MICFPESKVDKEQFDKRQMFLFRGKFLSEVDVTSNEFHV